MSFLTCVNRDFSLGLESLLSSPPAPQAKRLVRRRDLANARFRRDQIEVMYVNVVDPTTRNIS